MHQGGGFWTDELIRRVSVCVNLAKQVGTFAGGKEDFDAGIFLQAFDNRRDCRVIHRSPSVNQNLAFFSATTSLPTLVQPTQPLDGVTGNHKPQKGTKSTDIDPLSDM